MDDAKLECFIPRGVEGVAVRRFGSAIGAVDWAAYYLFNEDNEMYIGFIILLSKLYLELSKHVTSRAAPNVPVLKADCHIISGSFIWTDTSLETCRKVGKG